MTGARPRDYVETADGLLLAVVSPLTDAGRLVTSLRYVRHEGRLQKLGTEPAAALLALRHPEWLAHARVVDAVVHLVPAEAVVRVHRPDARLASLRAQGDAHGLEAAALGVVEILGRCGVDSTQLGLSGSLLFGAHTTASDIDLVAYGRSTFQAARAALRLAIAAGDLQEPGDVDWRLAWERRGSELTLEQYAWHERRKGTKAMTGTTRIDLSLVAHADEQPLLPRDVRKVGRGRVVAPVVDDRAAFDHPARYLVAGGGVSEVLAFTPTYAGQVVAGEVLDASGWIEEDGEGTRRLVVGSSREAPGEWIRLAPTSRGSSAGRPGSAWAFPPPWAP